MKILICRITHCLISSCLAAILTLAVLLLLAEPVNAGTFALRHGQAAAETVVQLSPSALDIPVSSSGTISLEVLGGVEINAYDVTVRYDPALITFVSWSHGPYLSRLAQVYKVDEPGKLRLVFTQLAMPPVSGDGILLNLVFRGAAEGVSEVLIEALDFAGADGTITNPQLIGASVIVTAALPTAAATPTLTLPPPANTPIATATQGLAVIATPDLTRTSPVIGTATPTRRLTTVNTLAGASTSSATGAAVTVLRQTQEGQLAEVPVTVPTSAPEPFEASDAVLRQAQEGQLVEAPVTELAEVSSNRLLNLALWAALGVFAIAFVWLALIAIRRNKTQSSDKE